MLKICHFLSYGLVLNIASKRLGCVSGAWTAPAKLFVW